MFCFKHINLTGDYVWRANKRVAKGGFRPLRKAQDSLSQMFYRAVCGLTYSICRFVRAPQIATNDLENQELTMLALHLLQICLVYINTLMIQRVLTEPDWTQRMLPEDLRALTPLIYSHSLRDFSARYESEAGDRTRCGCCVMLRGALLCPW